MPETISLKVIRSKVRRFVRSDPADIDDLVQDIWLICTEKGYKPSTKLVRDRCTDWLRRRRTFLNILDRLSVPAPVPIDHQEHEAMTELVNKVIRSAGLNRHERELLWRVFWQGLSVGTQGKLLESILLRLFIELKKG